MASCDVPKVSALHYKDPSKTGEEFEKHVCGNINHVCIQLVKRHKVMQCSINFCPSNVYGALAAMVERPTRDGSLSIPMQLLPVGCGISSLPMMALTSDPEYQEIGRESEEGWIEYSRGEIMVGCEKVFMDNEGIVDKTIANQVLEGIQGKFVGVKTLERVVTPPVWLSFPSCWVYVSTSASNVRIDAYPWI
ncbi:hypothetical protein CKAH01_13643 [Colletotrichum kahawae]|uniref:Uncharacterized protein n=1 Tax=Colletotrichum kahawae TaxID=34407 RepID=A0AAD9YPG0_COLKA|nr:hypothetical protein CKAH01_13643 [Colletotrichum kahawae]